MIKKGSIVHVNGRKGVVDRVFGGFAYVTFPLVNHRYIYEKGWYQISKLR